MGGNYNQGQYQEEISSIGTIRIIKTTMGTVETNGEIKRMANQVKIINHYKSTIWMKINGWCASRPIKKLSTQLRQLHKNTRRQDKGKSPNDHTEQINMVTVVGDARQNGNKVAKGKEQLSRNKTKNPYMPPINHDKVKNEELSKIELELGPNHPEKLGRKNEQVELNTCFNIKTEEAPIETKATPIEPDNELEEFLQVFKEEVRLIEEEKKRKNEERHRQGR
ncbi:hypothetical protein LWI28_021018 [Acer negundo]|uniref:Uncharacterized protein n=1 Tax=Acer negundo TaxID=4023 RepID=A0AAD5J289_ACENE|nr:hypothetical protein LWI28_021018 [Acer negundo]